MPFLHSLIVALIAQPAGPEVVTAEPVRVFAGHEDAVYDVALAPDGRTLATASFDRTVKMWNVESGAEVAACAGHGGKVLCVEFAPDGRTLLSGSDDKTVKLWDVPAGAAAVLAAQDGPVEAFALARDGSVLVTASRDGTARMWERAGGKEVRRLAAGPSPLLAVALDGSGRRIAAAGEGGAVRVWTLPAPDAPPPAAGGSGAVPLLQAGAPWRLWKGKEAPPAGWNGTGFDDSGWQEARSGFGYSSSEAELATVQTRLEDMPAAPYLSVFVRGAFEVPDPARVERLTLSVLVDDGFVAYLGGEEVGRENVAGTPPAFNATAATAGEPRQVEIDLTPHLPKLAAGKNVLAIQAHNAGTTSSDFVLTPALSAVVAKPPPEETPQEPAVLELAGMEGTVRAVALSPDGARVAAGGENGKVRVWQADDGAESASFDVPAAVTGLVFAGGEALAVACQDGTVRIWKASAPEPQSLAGHEGAVRALAWEDRSKVLASAGDDGTVRLWSLAEGKVLRQLAGHEGAVLAVAFDAGGKTLVSGGADGTLRAWSVEDGSAGARFENGAPVRSVGSPGEGRFYAAAAGGSHVLDWKVPSSTAVRTFTGHGGFVHAVAVAPDGATAASASQDKTVRFWNLAEGKELRSIEAHTSTVYCLAYSSDGSLLASGGLDRVVKIWRPADGTEVKRLEGHTDAVFCVAFSEDGAELFSGGSDLTVRRWSVAEGKELVRYESPLGWITGLGLVRGGEELITVGYGGRILTWKVADGAVISHRTVDPVVYSLAVSRDGRWTVTANPDRKALLLEN